MKLHLPKKLFAAVMACMATFSGLSTTIGTGFIAGGAMTIAFVTSNAAAEVVTISQDTPPIDWNSADLSADGYIVGTTEQRATLEFEKGNVAADAGDVIQAGPISVVNGRLQIHAWTTANVDVGTENKVELQSHVTLSNGCDIYFEDGGYYLEGGVALAEAATGTIESYYAKGVALQSLTGNNASTLILKRGGGDAHGANNLFSINGENTFAGTLQLDNVNGSASSGNWVVLNNVSALTNAKIDTGNDGLKNILALNVATTSVQSLSGGGKLVVYGTGLNSDGANLTAATLNVTNASGTFSGMIAEGVTLNISGGTQTMTGATLGSTVQVGTGATLTLSGSITLADSLMVKGTSAGNGFASVSATVASGTGTVDAANAVWYAEGGKKQGTLTNGVLTFTSSVYDIKEKDSKVSSTAGATGYNITGSGSTLTLNNVGRPEDLPVGVVINVGDAGTATVVISEGCDWTAAEADTILDKQSGSYELTVKDGAKLTFAEYKDLGTNVINIADGGEVVMSSGGHSAHFRGVYNVSSGGQLTLTAGDATGWGTGVQTINLKGSENGGAVMQVEADQTLVTNVNLNGDAIINSYSNKGLEFFGGTITVKGTNNVIRAALCNRNNGIIDVQDNSELSFTGIFRNRNGHGAEIKKTGNGTLILSGSDKEVLCQTLYFAEGTTKILSQLKVNSGKKLAAAQNSNLVLGATIVNAGTIDISASTLSLVPSSNFAKVEGKGGTESWSLNGTDGFVITDGAEYYLIKANGGSITGDMPTTISGYTITYADGNATFAADDVKGNIFHVNTQDITVAAEDVAEAVGYVVKDGLTATVKNATTDGLKDVTMENGSTLKLSSDASVEYIGGTFNVSGAAQLELSGSDITWAKQITCADADSALQLTVTDGSNVLWYALPHSGTGQGVNNVIVGVGSTLTVSETSTENPIFNGNRNQDTTITLKEGATLNSKNLFGWYTGGDARACTRIVNLEKNSTWNILSGGEPFYINRTTINLSGARVVLGDGAVMQFERPNDSNVNVISTTATAEQMSLITAAAGSATAGTLKFQNTGGVFDINRGSFTLDATNTADLRVDVAIVGNNKSLTKIGDGVLELTKANTYTGGTILSEGKLVLKGAEASLTSGVKFGGGTLVYNGSTADVSAASGIADGYTGPVKVEVVDDAATTDVVESVTWGVLANGVTSGITAAFTNGIEKTGSGTLAFRWSQGDESGNFAGDINVTGGIFSIEADYGTSPGNSQALTFSGDINVAKDALAKFSTAFDSSNSYRMTISGNITGNGTVVIGESIKRDNGTTKSGGKYYISGDNSSFAGTIVLRGDGTNNGYNFAAFSNGNAFGGANTSVQIDSRKFYFENSTTTHADVEVLEASDGNVFDGASGKKYTFLGEWKSAEDAKLSFSSAKMTVLLSGNINQYKGTLATSAANNIILGGEGVANAGGDIVATLGGSGTFRTKYSGDVKFTGKLADTAKLVKDGKGTLSLTYGHTSTGDITVADGTLKWVSDGTQGTLFAGSTIKLEAAGATATPTVEFAFGSEWAMGEKISGSGTIVQNSEHKLALSDIDAAWTGTLDVRKGTLGFDANYTGAFTAGTNRTVKLAQGAGLTGALTMSGGTLDLDVRNLGTGDTNAAASLGNQALTLSMGTDGAPLSTLNLTMLGTEVVGDTITLLSGVGSLTGITVGTDYKVDQLSNLFNVGTITIAAADGTSAAADMTDAEELLKSRLEDSIVYFEGGNLYLTLAASKLDVSPLYWEPSASGDGKWSGSSWATADADPGTTNDPGALVDPWPADKAAPDVYFTGDTAAKVTVDTDAVVSDLYVSGGSYVFQQDTVDDGNGGTTGVGSLSIQDKLSIGKDGAATFDMAATVKDIELTDSTAALTVNKNLKITGKVTATSGGTITNGMAESGSLVLSNAVLGGEKGNGLKLVGTEYQTIIPGSDKDAEGNPIPPSYETKRSGIALVDCTLTGQIDNSECSLQLKNSVTLDTIAMDEAGLLEDVVITYYAQDGVSVVPNSEENGYTKEGMKVALFTSGNVTPSTDDDDPMADFEWKMVTSAGTVQATVTPLQNAEGYYSIATLDASTEYVAGDADVAAVYDATSKLFSERATALVLKGGSIVLNTGLDKSEGSKLTGGIRAEKDGTITISENVTLAQADLNANGKQVTLLGVGTYDLGEGIELSTGVGLGADDASTADVEGWTGTVTTSAISVSDISALGNANSAVALTGDVVTTSLSTGSVGKVTMKSLVADSLESAKSDVSIAGATTLKKDSTVGTAAFNGGLTLGTEDGAATLTGEELTLSTLNMANLNSAVEAARLSNDSLNINIDKKLLGELIQGDYRSLVTLWDDDSLASLSFNGQSDCILEEKGAKYHYTIGWEETESVAPLATDDTTAGTNGEGTLDSTVDNVLPPANVVVLTTVQNPNYMKEKYSDMEENALAGADLLDDAFVKYDPQNQEKKGDIAAIIDAVDSNKVSQEDLAAVAGSSIATLGMALSGDVERQLSAIRNRTTSMGVNECVVNEGMPYFNAWVNAEGNRAELEKDSTLAGYTMDSWGGTVGFDVDLNPNLTMGMAITAMYGSLTADGPETKAEGDMDTYYVSLFARYASCAWTHTFVATVGMMDGSFNRTVSAGKGYETEGTTDGMSFGLMYEVGYVMPLDEDATACLQPVFNVMLRHSTVGSYTEEGGDAALDVGSQSMTTLAFGLGARLQAVVGESVYNRASIFEARVLGKVDVGDRQSEADVAFAGGSGHRSTVKSAELGAFGVELGAGLTIPMGDDDGSIFVDGSVELRSGYTNVNGTVGYRINF